MERQEARGCATIHAPQGGSSYAAPVQVDAHELTALVLDTPHLPSASAIARHQPPHTDPPH